MNKFSKMLLGTALFTGVGFIAYNTFFSEKTKEKIHKSVASALEAGSVAMKKISPDKPSVKELQEAERARAWVQEQWEKAGF